MIRNYLQEKGFDGLYHVGLTCCCGFVDTEFMPCDSPHIVACQAGYIQPEKPNDRDFVISPTRHLPCPKCKRPRPVANTGTGFLVCPHCKDDIPY